MFVAGGSSGRPSTLPGALFGRGLRLAGARRERHGAAARNRGEGAAARVGVVFKRLRYQRWQLSVRGLLAVRRVERRGRGLPLQPPCPGLAAACAVPVPLFPRTPADLGVQIAGRECMNR